MLNGVRLNVIMLNVVRLNVVMLNVARLNVVTLRVVAPPMRAAKIGLLNRFSDLALMRLHHSLVGAS
jgi:hypothetical protein